MITFFDDEEFYNDESALESLRERVAKSKCSHDLLIA